MISCDIFTDGKKGTSTCSMLGIGDAITREDTILRGNGGVLLGEAHRAHLVAEGGVVA